MHAVAKMANLTKFCQKFTQSRTSGEHCEFGENLGLMKANELARRALSKAATLAKAAILPVLPNSFWSKALAKFRQICQKPWQNFVKFAIFTTACISGHKCSATLYKLK